MKTIVKRLKGKTPDFWVKVQKVCGTVGVLSGAITAAVATGGIALPASAATVFGYMTAIGVFGTALGQLTIEDAK